MFEVTINVNANIHHHGDVAGMCEVRRLLEKIMATIDEVLAEVTDESTKIDGIGTLITGLKQQIADALSGATLPPSVQSKVDAVFATLQANKGKIDAALNANVPTP